MGTNTLNGWEMVIGLEVHAQISSRSKLFSGASAEFGAEPNSCVSFVDAGMPGMLPSVNKFCVEQAVRTALGLCAEINKYSAFDRKNYFYADLPLGYQITQFYHPIASKGKLTIYKEDGTPKDIGITRIQLEQDTGKSLHDQSYEHSLIDLNRAGVALMEIVSEPDIRSAHEAAEYVKKLRSMLRYLGTCNGDMEKGAFRCDVNVSVRRHGGEYGTRCEVKNINSIRSIMCAIEYEAQRQIEILESGSAVEQETRLFDAASGTTKPMRSKENAPDYRYFQDPDLPPVAIDDNYIIRIKDTMPELPEAKVGRYIDDLGLSEYDSRVLADDREVATYFEDVIACGADYKLAANWITVELFGVLNKLGMELADCKVTPTNLANLINLITDGSISGTIAKRVFEIMFGDGGDPAEIVDRLGLKQISDPEAIGKLADDALAANQNKVEEYRAGNKRLLSLFIGHAMRASGGKANPEVLNNVLIIKLEQQNV